MPSFFLKALSFVSETTVDSRRKLEGQLGRVPRARFWDQAKAPGMVKSPSRQMCDEAFCKVYRPLIWPRTINTDYNLTDGRLHEIGIRLELNPESVVSMR